MRNPSSGDHVTAIITLITLVLFGAVLTLSYVQLAQPEPKLIPVRVRDRRRERQR